MSQQAKKRESEYPKPPFPAQGLEKPGLEEEMEPRPVYEGREYRAAGKLEGKKALITGGDSGIGRAVAVLYAKEGADVAFTYLPEEEADARETCQAIEKEGRKALALCGDLTNADFCRSIVEDTVRELGGIDILVNNAAYQQHLPDIEELTEAQWDHTFKTNIYGYFRVTKAALEHMKPGAAIINSGSVTGLEGNPQMLDYASTKGAIHAFTKSLAKSLVKRGIRVNCVAPGPVWTPLNPAERSDEETRHFGEKVAMGRPAQPEEMAPAYVFFASEQDSSYVTGEVLALLGGETTAG